MQMAGRLLKSGAQLAMQCHHGLDCKLHCVNGNCSRPFELNKTHMHMWSLAALTPDVLISPVNPSSISAAQPSQLCQLHPMMTT